MAQNPKSPLIISFTHLTICFCRIRMHPSTWVGWVTRRRHDSLRYVFIDITSSGIHYDIPDSEITDSIGYTAVHISVYQLHNQILINIVTPPNSNLFWETPNHHHIDTISEKCPPNLQFQQKNRQLSKFEAQSLIVA